MKVGDLVKYNGYGADWGLIVGLIKTFPRQVVVKWNKDSQPAYFDWEEFEDRCHNLFEVISERR